VLVANGELPTGHDEAAVRAAIAQGDMVFAIDGGLRHCAARAVSPAKLIGDLDSVSAESVAQARAAGTTVIQHPTDKDATDLELGLFEAVAIGATSITVIAPFGGRLDHELATIGLLASPQWQPLAIDAFDGRRLLHVVHSTLDLAIPPGSSVSLIPWGGDCAGVSATGMQWPLDNADLPLGSTRGVSNVTVQPMPRVTLRSGTLLVVVDPAE